MTNLWTNKKSAKKFVVDTDIFNNMCRTGETVLTCLPIILNLSLCKLS